MFKEKTLTDDSTGRFYIWIEEENGKRRRLIENEVITEKSKLFLPDNLTSEEKVHQLLNMNLKGFNR